MKRQKRLTRRERKALEGQQAPAAHQHAHIHCIACGRHIDPNEFSQSPVRANYLKCLHGKQFASCKGCVGRAMELIREHDRTGRPVQAAQAWH